MKTVKKRRCNTGKPCGKTCIPKNHNCLVETFKQISQSLSKLSKTLSAPKFEQITPARASQVSMSTKEVVDLIKNSGSNLENTNGRLKVGSINWEAGIGKESKRIGGGAFGSFFAVPPDKLAKELEGKFPDGVGIKYGKIRPSEIEILRKADAAGVGPPFLASKLTRVSEGIAGGKPVQYGMVAMGVSPGEQLDKLGIFMPISGKDRYFTKEAYISAMAELHKAGIAHNDAHGGNALYEKGRVRLIDFGLSQANPKAALSEALAFISGMNPQSYVSSYDDTPRKRILAKNLERRVIPLLESRGFTKDEIRDIMNFGTKNSDEDYEEGAYGKMSASLAKQLISEFYRGIVPVKLSKGR